MNVFPINQTDLDLRVIEVLPKMDMDTGTQKKNADNAPQWIVRCLVSGGPLTKPTVTDVTVPATAMPELVPMSSVQFEFLQGRPWDTGGRSGVAFSAQSVRPWSKGTPPPAPVQNGTKPAEPAKV